MLWSPNELQWFFPEWQASFPVLECPGGRALVAIAELTGSESSRIAVFEAVSGGFKEVAAYDVSGWAFRPSPLCDGSAVAFLSHSSAVAVVGEDGIRPILKDGEGEYPVHIATSPVGDVFVVYRRRYAWLDKRGSVLHGGELKAFHHAPPGAVFLPEKNAFACADEDASKLFLYVVRRDGEVERAFIPVGLGYAAGLSKHGVCVAKHSREKDESTVWCLSFSDFIPAGGFRVHGSVAHAVPLPPAKGVMAVVVRNGNTLVEVLPEGRVWSFKRE